MLTAGNSPNTVANLLVAKKCVCVECKACCLAASGPIREPQQEPKPHGSPTSSIKGCNALARDDSAMPQDRTMTIAEQT